MTTLEEYQNMSRKERALYNQKLVSQIIIDDYGKTTNVEKVDGDGDLQLSFTTFFRIKQDDTTLI